MEVIASPITTEPNYSAEEVEFLRALEQYRSRNRRVVTTAREMLAVFLSLGYRKVAQPGPLPVWKNSPAHQEAKEGTRAR